MQTQIMEDKRRGRKTLYDFDGLQPGERMEATGNALLFKHQYAHSYNNRKFNPPQRRILVVKDGDKFFFEKER